MFLSEEPDTVRCFSFVIPILQLTCIFSYDLHMCLNKKHVDDLFLGLVTTIKMISFINHRKKISEIF